METILSIRPCVLQTIIICSTIVVVCLIGVSAYRVYKSQQRSWGSYIFLASALLLLAITIFSHCFCQDRNVLDFISLASALISIILAIITIIYSYYTNSSNSTQIERLNKAAEDVRTATAIYSDSATELRDNITRIIESINKVDEKTDEMMAMMSLPSETIQSISRIEPVSAPQTDNKNQIHNIVPLQIIVVYICTKAKQHNKDWDLDLLPPSLREYAAGILVTLNSVSLITIKTDHKTVKVMDIHEVLVEKVAPLIDQVVKDPTLPNIQEIKQNIDAYFL